MWSPTHIKVTIRSARGLLVKGKNNTNNCFVTIALGKERYQTSIKDKAESNVTWNEECELKIPDQGNRAELILTCLHRNNLGLDEFLGQVTLPLNEMDVYERPRPRWIRLESKPGKEKKNKERGELDVLISFTVKSGSLTDLSKKEKHKSSIGQLASSVGGSLLSIGTLEKRKGIKKFAKSLGSKMHLHGGKHKKSKDGDDDILSYTGSFASIGTPNREKVIDSEEEDDFQFDNLSQKSSVSSLNIRDSPRTGTHQNQNQSRTMVPSKNSVIGGKQHQQRHIQQKTYRNDGFDNLSVEPEFDQTDMDLSIRSQTLPPPSKPPRIQQLTDIVESEQQRSATASPTFDEWEEKLYGRYVEKGGLDSLKRRSWEPNCVPLPSAKKGLSDITLTNDSNSFKETVGINEINKNDDQEQRREENAECDVGNVGNHVANEEVTSSSSSDEFEDASLEAAETKSPIPDSLDKGRIEELSSNIISSHDIRGVRKESLISPDCEKNEFKKFNASFAEFEQRHSDKIYNTEINDISAGTESPAVNVEEKFTKTAESFKDNEVKSPTLEDDIKRREAKRQEEDQRILNFDKRLTSPKTEKIDEVSKSLKSIDEGTKDSNNKSSTKISHGWIFKPNTDNSPKKFMGKVSERTAEEHERERVNNQLNFIKQIKKREAQNGPISTFNTQTGERIIIGHEKSAEQSDRRAEISAALTKKYDGKSREELMLIANGMENEALIQRQRVKELEDYLDNLLLRVMETHPKLLQNPYSRTTSAKSG